jgi:aspartyl-tRNA(Asn)/glutamyl-tRNA(Gln) amidotransferase subunit B
VGIDGNPVTPQAFGGLLQMVAKDEINQNTAKEVLAEMFASGKVAPQIVSERGLRQISDAQVIAEMVRGVLAEHPQEVGEYLAGKEAIARWLFGQVMRAAKGQANPKVIQQALEQQLLELGESQEG